LRELTVAVGLPQLQAARARLSRFIALLDHPADSAVALVAMGLGRGSPP
jgi:hypothetical protein